MMRDLVISLLFGGGFILVVAAIGYAIEQWRGHSIVWQIISATLGSACLLAIGEVIRQKYR